MRNLEKPNWKKQTERKRRAFLIGASLFFLIPIGFVSAYVLKNSVAGKSAVSEAEMLVNSSTITVKAGGDFQAALNRAKGGETILLQAGATFKGAFKLPNKSGNEFITVRSSASDAQLPPEGARLDPKKYAAILPKIESNVKGEPAISAADGAHHYRFIGVEFAPTIEGLYNIVQLGTTEEKSIEELPHHIEFDRVYLHGSPTFGQRRGIAANGRFIKIQNSYFSDFKRKGEESQAIAAWATDGPVEITNNYLEAAAEGVIFGGAESALGVTPTDCIVRGNYFNKPVEWRQTDWVVKNQFEIKNGQNIKIENNLMTNNWLMAQEGTAVVFTTRVDSGKNAIIKDIEFSGNVVRGAGSAVNVYGAEGRGGHNLVIRNNIFEDIDGEKWGGRGFFMKSTAWDGLTVENNTVIQTGSITIAYEAPVNNFIFRNNIIFQNDYGFFGDGVGVGKATLNRYFPNAVIDGNVIVGGDAKTYGQGNFYPASLRQIGFVNSDASDFHLRADSPYLKKGFDGKQIGANLDARSVGGK